MDDQNKNMILAIALSFAVILVWTIAFPPPAPDPQASVPVATTTADGGLITPSGTTQTAVPEITAATPAQTRDAAIAATQRVKISTPSLSGSISLIGGRIDDLKLNKYRTTVEKDADIVTLYSPAGGPDAYYAVHGWVGLNGLSNDLVPNARTEWQVESGGTLSVNEPVTLVWDNGAGLIFRKTIGVDADYLFTIEQSVENTTADDQRLFPYGIIARIGLPDLTGFFVLHEGLIGSADGQLIEEDYGDLTEFDVNPAEGGAVNITEVSQNGWIGFTDHYWMTTLIPQHEQNFSSVAKYTQSNDTYQAETRLPAMSVAAGQTTSIKTQLFAGAKDWEIINRYEKDDNINQFVDSIDWGWFYFLTKPIFRALHFFNQVIGNMGWAILALTFLIKLILFPLAYKSYVSMARMKELQPEMEKIKEKVGDDRQKLQQEMMQLYKTRKVNPASGCLPILVQIPIFFSLYKVIFVTLDLRHAPFFGWIQDLSAPDPSSILNLFGLLPWGAPDPGSLFAIFSIGVFPILMGITMWMQQKLNPAPTDKTQAMIFAWMPWVFMFMLGGFASGLVIYWCANNIITFTQQYTIMRSQGVKPDVFGNIMSSFKRDRSAE